MNEYREKVNKEKELKREQNQKRQKESLKEI
jgi:hypothetical protein